MNIVAQLIADLNTAFAEVDAANAVRAVEWARGRCEAIAAYRLTEDYAERRKKGAWGGHYQMMFNIAGGKTWYKVFEHGFHKAVEDFMAKNSAANVEKRNALIARKLEALNVTGITDTQYTRTSDGFNGVYVVSTPEGQKSIVINTIFAGGYNIQCLHTRTTVKIR